MGIGDLGLGIGIGDRDWNWGFGLGLRVGIWDLNQELRLSNGNTIDEEWGLK